MYAHQQNALAVIIVMVAFICLLAFGVVLLVQSEEKQHAERVKTGFFLPEGATDIISVGDDWQEFTYKDQRFLFHQVGGNRGYECIVKIDAEKPEKELEK